MVTVDVIQFNFESDVEKGFYLFGNQIVPIRKQTTILVPRQCMAPMNSFLVYLTLTDDW